MNKNISLSAKIISPHLQRLREKESVTKDTQRVTKYSIDYIPGKKNKLVTGDDRHMCR